MALPKKTSFFYGRLLSVGYVVKGAWYLLTHEHSVMVQAAMAVAVTAMGFYFDITKTEWLFQILAIGLVLTAEGMNTAVEEIANFVHPNYHKKIGLIKDIAGGAVLFAALAAIGIGLLIYLPYFTAYF